MIVVFSITCNRIDVSKRWLPEMGRAAGASYKHIVFDNGSVDGTVDWLRSRPDLFDVAIEGKKNHGILVAMQYCIDYAIRRWNPEYLVKFDDDCKIITDNLLAKMTDFMDAGCKSRIIAPREVSIVGTHFYPHVYSKITERGINFEITSHTGGIVQLIPRDAAKVILKEPRKNQEHDLFRCQMLAKKGFDIMYCTDWQVEHKGVDSQSNNYKF